MAVTKNELITWAKGNGWTEDRFGHLQKTNGPSRYRLKLSSIAARYEVKTDHGWVRLWSGYYKNLSVSPDGKLVGMTGYCRQICSFDA